MALATHRPTGCSHLTSSAALAVQPPLRPVVPCSLLRCGQSDCSTSYTRASTWAWPVGPCNPHALHRQRNMRVWRAVRGTEETAASPAITDDGVDDELELGLMDDDAEEQQLGRKRRQGQPQVLEGIPLPEARHQRRMPYKEVKALRSRAEELARDKQLLRIQVGQQGLTHAFLCACMDILHKHELVRVKLGEGCGLERSSTAATLEHYLDCVCVHQIGFTVTLYRQSGLARPSNTLLPQATADVAPTVQPASVDRVEGRPSTAEKRREARKQVGQQKPGKRPPEFEVV